MFLYAFIKGRYLYLQHNKTLLSHNLKIQDLKFILPIGCHHKFKICRFDNIIRTRWGNGGLHYI